MLYGCPECLGKCIIPYNNDILIYSPNLQNHVSQDSHVLELLRENQLYVKGQKCKFHASSVSFLL